MRWEGGQRGRQTRKYLTSTIKVLPYSAVTQRGSNETSGSVSAQSHTDASYWKHTHSHRVCHSLAEGQPDPCVVPWRWDNPHCPVGSPGTVPACTLGPGSRKSQLSARNIDPMGRFFCFGTRDPHSCTFFQCQGRRRPERTERRRRGGAPNSRGHFRLGRPQRTRR